MSGLGVPLSFLMSTGLGGGGKAAVCCCTGAKVLGYLISRGFACQGAAHALMGTWAMTLLCGLGPWKKFLSQLL